MPVPFAPLAPPPLLSVASWRGIEGLRHGFFGRRGGCSVGDRGSLNVSHGVGDDAAAVDANWQRVCAAFPGVAIARMRQVHGAQVVRVRAGDRDVGEADAMLTDLAGVGLAVLTADCVPILAVAPDAAAVMAVHAGWRGTLAGVAAQAIDAGRRQCAIEPRQWRFALGPAIDGCCYEVGQAIGRQVVERWGAMPDAWQPSGDRGQLDLRSVNRRILEASEVPADHIELVGPCTSCQADDYFSHRRSAGRAGRQASIIGIAA